MPRSTDVPESRSKPSAWVFAAPGAGDNRQLETLVGLIDADAHWIGPVDEIGTVLIDRIVDAGGRRIPQRKRERLAPPWPDLVLTAGGRSVIDAKRIRRASGGRSKIVCLGRPWAPLAWFDLVFTTPQYRLPAAPNVLTLDLPLNLPPTVGPADLDGWRRTFRELPRPHLAVLLGGDSGSYRFTPERARALADELERVLDPAGGSAIVAASPRTPTSVVSSIGRNLTIPVRVYPAGSAANPYPALLRSADAVLVTSDSASMLAEACLSGKPVATFDLHERPRSRLNRALRGATPFAQPILEGLTRRGMWIPARDLTEIHVRLESRGWSRPLERFDFAEATPAIDPESIFAPVHERIDALLNG